ncbi:hypothetical protein CDCA_CDCA01G0293 [Cyanidium caldarium]|uniref:Tr-type G domain-containing protein n=1 Tax=Cyanidium caldarium TaxID=2771 RepID=A0AAV9IPU6_CYACA|nr:hypothetical protein CDCA_CDCA01G0293 [Cyanidium caldarium]
MATNAPDDADRPVDRPRPPGINTNRQAERRRAAPLSTTSSGSLESQRLQRVQQILTQRPERIRNICIVGHIDHGKTTLADWLLAANGFLSHRLVGKARYMDFREDEQQRGITMKSAGVTLWHQHRSSEGVDGVGDCAITLIDSPGHVDFAVEVSAAARLSDGALVVVDVVEGVCSQTRAVLRRALQESLRPVLVLNKLDRLALELHMTPDEAYAQLRCVLEDANAILGAYEAEMEIRRAEENALDASLSALGDALQLQENGVGPVSTTAEETCSKVQFFQPESGNVLFASAYDGWGFRVRDFARIGAARLGVAPQQLRDALWGDYCWHARRKHIVPLGEAVADKPRARPLFVQLVLENIWHVYRNFMEASAAAADGTLAVRDQIAARVGVAVPERDLHHRDARHALQSLMSRWLPLNRAVLDTVVEHVPSPLQALSARLEMLWPHTRKASPSALQQRAAMRHGDTTPESPLMMLVGKMFHIEASLVPPALRRQLEARAAVENHDADEDGADRPPGSLLALARVFCGSLNSTGNLWVYGPRYRADVGATHQAPYCYEMAGAALNVLLLNGRDFVPLTDSPTKSTARTAIAAGAVVAIAGLDACVLKTATVSSLAPGVCLPFAPLSDIGGARPVVRVALEPAARLSELPRLRRGLRLLSQADPAVETFVSESGELILGVSGELHLERCLTDLRETFARVEIKASSPMIAFRETVAGGVSITPQNPWVTSQRQLPKMRHGEESAAAAAAAAATHDDEEDANIASESDGMTDAEIVSREPAAAYPDAELLRGLRAGGAVMVPLPNEGIELAIRALPLPLALANGIEAAPLWVLRALFRGRGDRARSTTEWSPATKMLFAELCEAVRRDVFEVGERDAATEDAPSSDRDTASRTSILGSLLAQRTIDMGPHGVGPVWLLGPLCLQEHSAGEGDDEVMRLRDMLRAIFCGERPGATADIGVDMPPLPPAVRRSLISAFQLVAAAGPLCDEPLLGVALVVSTRQLPPSESTASGLSITLLAEALRKAFLAANPRLAEPVLRVEIHCSAEALGQVHSVLSATRARVLHERLKEHHITSMFVIHAYLPVHESFGFVDRVRRASSGAVADVQMRFDGRWQLLPQDPFWAPTTESEVEELGVEDGINAANNVARKLVEQVRVRKGQRVAHRLVERAEKQRTLARKK